LLFPEGLLTLAVRFKPPVIAATNSLATQRTRVSPAEGQSKEGGNDTPDLREFLNRWPYNPDDNVRLAHGADGREILLVRRAMGIETYEANGRPDGGRPHWMGSVLEFHLHRLAVAKQGQGTAAFKLSPADCNELFEEGILYWHRSISFCRLKDWDRAERDTARIIGLVDFVRQYAANEAAGAPQRYRPLKDVRVDTLADTTFLGSKAHCQAIPDRLDKGTTDIVEIPEPLSNRGAVLELLLQKLKASLAIPAVLPKSEKSMFRLEGDYVTICYRTDATILKATRGLDFLGYLLRNPGREIHVSELLPEGLALARSTLRCQAGIRVATPLAPPAPILDSKAKAEYRRRLHELRKDIEEAEQWNDPYRAASSRDEFDAIGRQLAAAVGLGGRDRRASSEAERARSAVTKRIKDAIKRIEKTIPALGSHLSARVKTGYYCSYNPHPDRPVPWEF
jgi:hypothetical protein